MLTFIKDKNLRKTIQDSTDYINVILKETNNSNRSKSYREETYRVIILYSIAVIEAVLLYVLKERKDNIVALDYKIPNEISKKIKHADYPKGTLVTAVRVEKVKPYEELGVQELVNFMKNKKLMKKATSESILTLNNIRNTFHFNKSRDDIDIKIEKVEESLSLLLKIIKNAPSAISKQID